MDGYTVKLLLNSSTVTRCPTQTATEWISSDALGATTTPPVQHLEAICRNASIYHEKWGEWPMSG